MTTGIEQMLRAELRDTKLKLEKHQRTILTQMETIASLNRQIAALGKVIEGKAGAVSSTHGKSRFHSCDIPGCAVCDPTSGL